MAAAASTTSRRGAAEQGGGSGCCHCLRAGAARRGAGAGRGRTVRFCRARRTKVSTRLTAISLSSPADCIDVGMRGGEAQARGVRPPRCTTPTLHLQNRQGACCPRLQRTRRRLVHEQNPGLLDELHTDCRRHPNRPSNWRAVAQGMQPAGSQGKAVGSFKAAKAASPSAAARLSCCCASTML